jgi:hypothetical protein
MSMAGLPREDLCDHFQSGRGRSEGTMERSSIVFAVHLSLQIDELESDSKGITVGWAKISDGGQYVAVDHDDTLFMSELFSLGGGHTKVGPVCGASLVHQRSIVVCASMVSCRLLVVDVVDHPAKAARRTPGGCPGPC